MFEPAPTETWEQWNKESAPQYPHAKVIQYCLRTFPKDVRMSSSALDLGCGNGVNSWFLAREGFKVTATDVSSSGVDQTITRLSADGLRCSARVESATDVSDPAESFDFVTCIGVLEAMGPDLSRLAVKQVHRVLRPQGKALFVFASAEDFRSSSPETAKLLYCYSRAEVEELFGCFAQVEVDTYRTSHGGGEILQSDWFVKASR